jgi:hypothetical protein
MDKDYHKKNLMTRKERIEQYKRIRESALDNPQVKRAISEKNHALTELNKSHYLSFQTPNPRLTPTGTLPDERFRKSKTQTDEKFREKYQKLSAEHDQKIYELVKQDFLGRGELDKNEFIQELGAEKTVILMQQEGVKQLIDLEDREKQPSQLKELDQNFDQRKIDKDVRSLEQNKQDMDIDYRLDEMQMDDLLNDSRSYDLDLDQADKNKIIDQQKPMDKTDQSEGFE